MKNKMNQVVSADPHQNKINEIEDKIALLENEKAELLAKLNWFEEHFRLNQHRLFGRSSEQTVHAEQQTLFNEAEALDAITPTVQEPTLEEITYKRKKKQKGHREEMLKDLPVEIIEHKLPEEEQVCDVCGNCEENEISIPVITASMPKRTLPGSIASAATIAYVMIQKYMFGVTLYSQETYWKQLDIEISRQTIANWLILASTRWLSIILEQMHRFLLQYDIIHADETTLQILHEPGRPASSESYMWLYRTGRQGPHIALFDYQAICANQNILIHNEITDIKEAKLFRILSNVGDLYLKKTTSFINDELTFTLRLMELI